MVGLATQFAILAVVIIAAGMILTKCADAIGELTGLGGSLSGMILAGGCHELA